MAYSSIEIVSVEYLVEDDGSKVLVLKRNNGEFVEFPETLSQITEAFVSLEDFLAAIATLTNDLNAHLASDHSHPDLASHVAMGLEAS